MATQAVTAVRITAKDDASAILKKLGRNVGEVKSEFLSFRNVLVGVAGGAVVAGFRSIINSLDALEESAQSVGVTVEQLSALRYAASFSSVSAEELDKALVKLSGRLADAATGGKESAAVFEALGIRVRNSSGQLLATDEALKQIADKLAGYRDGAAKTALATDLFGKAGYRLIPFLNQGAAGLERLRAEAERLGIVIGGDTVSAAAKFNDELDRLTASSKAASIALASELLPFLTRTVQEFTAARAAAGSLPGALSLLARQSAETLVEPGAKLDELRAKLSSTLEALRDTRGESIYAESRRKNLQERVDGIRREIEFLKELQVNRALANAGQVALDPRLARGLPDAPTPRKPVDPKKEEIGEAQRALAQYVEQLERERQKLEEITEVEKALLLLRQLGPTGQIPQVQQLVIEMAKQNDQLRQEEELRKLIAEAMKKEEQAQAALRDEAERYFEAALTPLEQMERKLERLSELWRKNAFGAEGSAEAWEKFRRASEQVVREGLEKISDKAKDAKDIAKELGLTFSSAFEDAVVGGKRLSDVIKGIGDDILRILTRKIVTEPFANAVSGFFATAIGSWFGGGGLSGYNWGGGMAAGGPVAAGNAYLIGERGPELFVPRVAGTVVPNGARSEPSVRVNVINQGPPARVEQQTRRTPDGVVVDLVLREIEADVQRGGRVSAAMQRQFGLNRALGLAR